MFVSDISESTSRPDLAPKGGLGLRLGTWLVGIAAAVAAVFAFLHLPAPPPQSTSVIEVDPVAQPAPQTQLTVHVAGAVRAPGLVVVAAGARVADAIAAAGGASTSADLTSINLAAPVEDGMQLLVPDIAGSVVLASAGAMTADGMIDINRAGIDELLALPGVGTVLAGRIVSYREANGPFGAVEDLLGVSGIGEGKLAAIREVSVVR